MYPLIFLLIRTEDPTGVSGTGVVAEGVVFEDDTVVLKWKTEVASIGIYSSLYEMQKIHCHGNKSYVEWLNG